MREFDTRDWPDTSHVRSSQQSSTHSRYISTFYGAHHNTVALFVKITLGPWSPPSQRLCGRTDDFNLVWTHFQCFLKLKMLEGGHQYLCVLLRLLLHSLILPHIFRYPLSLIFLFPSSTSFVPTRCLWHRFPKHPSTSFPKPECPCGADLCSPQFQRRVPDAIESSLSWAAWNSLLPRSSATASRLFLSPS